MSTSRTTTRRAVLGALGVAGAGLSGCLGGDGGPTPVETLPAPVQGDPAADVTVMAFEDYACPHCRTYVLEVLPELEADYVEPGRIRYEHHDYPIPVDGRWSWVAAGAARAVQDQVGDDAFFEYSRLLFDHQNRYSMDVIGRLAGQVGADPDRVRRAASEGVYRPVLEADRQRGRELGLDGTPEVFVNGRKTEGYDVETVSTAIEAALG